MKKAEIILVTDEAVSAGECAPFCQPLQPCVPEQGCNPFALCIPEMSGCIPTAACQPDVLCVPGAGGNPCLPDGCSPMAWGCPPGMPPPGGD